MSYRVSFTRILARDWPSFVFAGMSVLGALVLGLVWLVLELQGKTTPVISMMLLVVSVGMSVSLLLCALVRAMTIRRTLRTGQRVRGTVQHTGSNFRGITHADIRFALHGVERQVRIVTYGFPKHVSPRTGEQIELMVDPSDPEQAFLPRPFTYE